jgi:hypothetical protein
MSASTPKRLPTSGFLASAGEFGLRADQIKRLGILDGLLASSFRFYPTLTNDASDAYVDVVCMYSSSQEARKSLKGQ